LEKWEKKLENHEIWANSDLPPQFFWGSPQNFETSFGYSFSGTIARKMLDHAPDPKGVGKNPPKGYKLDIVTHYHL